MTDSSRLDRLRLAQREIVGRLEDPATKAYSVAPLANQLRLVEGEIARLTARENDDAGLPDPETLGFVDILAYGRWLEGRPFVPSRRKKGPGEWWIKQTAIFEGWRDAGFVLSTRSPDIEEWVEENRVRLIACLQKQ